MVRNSRLCFLIWVSLLASILNGYAQAKQINSDSVKRLVQILSSDTMEGRAANSEGALKAATFIAEEFKACGLKKIDALEDYFDEVPGEGPNVIGVIEGTDRKDELIIFSAHYDHIGKTTQPLVKTRKKKLFPADTIYNGANDNASGTAAMIVLARHFALQKPLSRTMLFVAFTAEEKGMIGSQDFVSKMDSSKVISVINLEMLGRGKRPYITGNLYSDLRQIFNLVLFEKDPVKYKKNYFAQDSFGNQRLFSRSDNFPFALKGINAHTIMSTSPTDIYYHNLNDEYDTLDYKAMAAFVEAIADACEPLISGRITPSRIRLPLN